MLNRALLFKNSTQIKMNSKTDSYTKATNAILAIVRDLPAGSHTAPKIVKYNETYAVLKMPVAKKNRQDWERDIRTQIEVADKIKNFSGNLHIPKILEYKQGPDGFIVEEMGRGNALNNDTVHALSPAEKQKLAANLAEFLNYMHQQTITNTESIYHFHSSLDTPDKSAEQRIIERFTKAMPELADELKTYFDPKNYDDNVTVLTHGDIRAANILYDNETGQFTLIDFGNARHGNKYHDMVIFTSGANIELFPIMLNTASIYNTLPKQTMTTCYNPETIKNLFIRNLIFENGSWAIRHEASDAEIRQEWEKEINPQIQRIEQMYQDFIIQEQKLKTIGKSNEK